MRAHLLALLLAAPLQAAAATPVVLLPPTGANVQEGHLAAAGDALRASLERTGAFEVHLAAGAPGLRAEPTPAEAAEAARSQGAALGVTLRVSRLGTVATVRLAAWRPDGAIAHTDELSAAGPDDLEPVLRRLARGLAEGRPARVLAEVDTVTQREADPYRKYAATQVFGLRLGTAFLLDRATDGTSRQNPGGGCFWLYDARTFLADLSFDLYNGEDDAMVQLGLGFYYPLSRANMAPYVGGGVAYSWVDTGGDGGSGLAIKVAGGLLVGRLSTVQIRLEGGWQVSTFAERTSAGTLHSPHGPFFSVGLGY